MEFMLTGRRAHRTLATLGLAAIIVTGCATPGAVATPTPATTPVPTTAPTAAPAESGSPAVSASPVAAGPNCGTDPITLSAYVETISELVPKLSEEFTKQFPNVTWDI